MPQIYGKDGKPLPQQPTVPTSKTPTQQPQAPAVPAWSGPLPPTPPPTPGQAPVLPPTQNGPIFPESQGGPGGPQPISLQGGAHYNPTTAPFGFDMSTPGVFEQMQQNNQNLWFSTPGTDWAYDQLDQFSDPWAYEQWVGQNAGSMGGPSETSKYWSGIQGSMNTPTGAEKAIAGGYQGPNNAQSAFDITRGRLPDSFQPQFDAYYDRMKDKVMSDVNSQSAARGNYGSSSALNGAIGAGLDVEAQRAKAATDFMFADSQNQMNWLNSLSQQGRGADLSGLGIFGANLSGAQYGLDKTKTLGDLAFRADQTDIERDRLEADLRKSADDARAGRISAGISTGLAADSAMQGRYRDAFDFAGQAQDAREGRINTLYGQNEDFSNDVLQFLGGNFDKLLGLDEQSFESELETMIAQEADARGWSQQQQERIMRDAKTVWDMYKGKQAEDASKK